MCYSFNIKSKSMIIMMIIVKSRIFAQNLSDFTQFGLSALSPIVWNFWFPLK